MPRIKEKKDLPDIQEQTSGFPKKKIKKVGIRDVIVPISVIRKDNSINQTSANVSIYTDLSSDVKGANMSRYRIILEEYLLDKHLYLREYVREVLNATQTRLNSKNSYLKIKFDYFLVKKAPASKLNSYMNYKCCIEARAYEKWKSCAINDKGEDIIRQMPVEEFYLTVQVPYTSLCPCSKEISDHGAHNQRSYADVTVKLVDDQTCWIEDIVNVVESVASAPIINGLKREDEAYQTERMYENPQFVEDIVRLVAEELDKKYLDKTISDYVVVTNHEESIHTHKATAVMTAGREMQ